MKNLFFLLLLFLFSACEEKAKIQVMNRVHNVRLDNVSFSGVHVGTYLLPGETAESIVTDKYEDISFPVRAQLEFYMVKGDKKVYLKTKDYFTVDKDQTLKIEVSDDTELVSPMK